MTSSVEFTVANIISGPGRLIHAGLGTLSLIGNNTYSGDTVLPNGGKIKLGHSNAIGCGELILSESCQIDLTGGITVTNDVVLSPSAGLYSYGTTNFSNLSGSNIIHCNILAQISASILRFTNNAEPGTSLTIGGTITGPTTLIALRGSGGGSAPRYGFFNTPVNDSDAIFEIAGDTHWTISSAGNNWAYTSLRSGTGNMILGIENALDTAARVKWGENATNCLDLNGYHQTVAGLDYTGVSTSGGVTNESKSDSTLRLEGLTTDYNFAGTIRDGATNRVHLVMTSPSRTQTLSGSLAYTGDTTIEAGTLALSATTALGDASTVRINGGTSILSLSTGITDVVNALVIDGVMKAPGTWGTTASLATYKDDIHFSGTGVLQVVPYTTWANSFGLQEPWPGGDDSLNGNRAADPDHDGLTNFEEFAFGLFPITGTSPSPIVVPLDKTTGVFSYTRRKPSLTGLQYHYVYSTSLVGEWPSFTPDFENIDLGDPVETVSAVVPSSLLASPKLFIRVFAK
ncbi:MAG: autotransporter-associated beta strand repeat-containing protein [Gloeobacteraceae cyanobacterium ES-bin-144]|nr:autotransporter-associated beta strand repeat-containing protein [Verrucomicrobiales bacterium]